MFGTRVAKPILAAVMCAVRPLDRTYDRKRSDPHAAPPLAGRGPSTYGFRARATQVGRSRLGQSKRRSRVNPRSVARPGMTAERLARRRCKLAATAIRRAKRPDLDK